MLIGSMTRLNKNASECMVRFEANACTDVTGFGLAGHSMQLAKASNVVLKFRVKDLPVLEGAEKAISENYLTRGDKSNREYTKEYVISSGKVNKTKEHLLYDPQTSGGLLICVPQKNADALLDDLHKNGDILSGIIGEVLEASGDIRPGSIVFEY